MILEHVVYSTAIALIFGLVYYRFTGRDYFWIVIASSYIPDLDLIANPLLSKLGITLLIFGHPIAHGYFHNIIIMLIYSAALAFLLHPLGIRLIDSFVFALVGFAAHMFEDALIANPAYSFFYPLTTQHLGIGAFKYRADVLGIADREVLLLGFVLLGLSLALKIAAMWIERTRQRSRLLSKA